MTHKTNRYRIYQVDHTTFGGIVYSSDFDTSYANGTIAERIARDAKFDQQCRKNKESKKYGGKKND